MPRPTVKRDDKTGSSIPEQTLGRESGRWVAAARGVHGLTPRGVLGWPRAAVAPNTQAPPAQSPYALFTCQGPGSHDRNIDDGFGAPSGC